MPSLYLSNHHQGWYDRQKILVVVVVLACLLWYSSLWFHALLTLWFCRKPISLPAVLKGEPLEMPAWISLHWAWCILRLGLWAKVENDSQIFSKAKYNDDKQSGLLFSPVKNLPGSGLTWVHYNHWKPVVHFLCYPIRYLVRRCLWWVWNSRREGKMEWALKLLVYRTHW